MNAMSLPPVHSPVNWSASWIWDSCAAGQKNYHLYLRAPLELEKVGSRVLVHISADSRYILYVNGERVGRGPVRCYPEWQYYDTYDIAPLVRAGTNTLAVHGYYQGECNSDYIVGLGGVIVQVCNDDSVVCFSGTDWKVRRAAQFGESVMRKRWQDFIEIRDGRLDCDGWERPDFNDSAWEQAVEVKHDPDSYPRIPAIVDLTPRDIPSMAQTRVYPRKVVDCGECEEIEIIPDVLMQLLQDCYTPCTFTKIDNVQELLQSGGGSAVLTPIDPALCETQGIYDSFVIIDFGKEVIGYPRIELTAAAGTIIDVAYSERLLGGRVPPHFQTISYVDRYICKEGAQEWEHYGWKGFRYMLLVVRCMSAPVKITSVSLDFTTYPVDWKGSFDSSDKTLNRLWAMGAYTTQLCMLDGYMDCPWREKAQWVGDARVATLVNYTVFGDQLLARKFLNQTAQSQTPLGITSQVAPFLGSNLRYPPSNETHESFTGISDYCLHWISSLSEYLLYTGDTETARRLYPAVRKGLSWFEHFRTPAGLLNQLPGWRFIDWADIDKTGLSAVYAGLYALALESTADLAHQLGYEQDSRELREQFAQTVQGVRDTFFDPTVGVVFDNFENGRRGDHLSMHANALAVLCGAVKESEYNRLFDFILDPGNKAEITQPFFSHFLLLALHKGARTADSLAFIAQNWGPMIAAGNETVWELWSVNTRIRDSIAQPNGHRHRLYAGTQSMAHAFSAAPTFYLTRCVLGILPLEPGFKSYEIRPDPAGLSRISGTIPTPAGVISVALSCDAAIWKVRIEAPSQLEGTLVLPRGFVVKSVSADSKPVEHQSVAKESALAQVRLFGQSVTEVVAVKG